MPLEQKSNEVRISTGVRTPKPYVRVFPKKTDKIKPGVERIESQRTGITSSIEAILAKKAIERDVFFGEMYAELSAKIDLPQVKREFDPLEEAILRVQHLSVRIALDKLPYSLSEVAKEVLQIKEYLRSMQVRSFQDLLDLYGDNIGPQIVATQHLYSEAASMLDYPIRKRAGIKNIEIPLWQQIRLEMEDGRVRNPLDIIRDFINPHYKR